MTRFIFLIAFLFSSFIQAESINIYSDDVAKTKLSKTEIKQLKASFEESAENLVKNKFADFIAWSHIESIPKSNCFNNEITLSNYTYYELLRINQRKNINTPTYKELFKNDCTISAEGIKWHYNLYKNKKIYANLYRKEAGVFGLSQYEITLLKKNYKNVSTLIIKNKVSDSVVWSHMQAVPQKSCFNDLDTLYIYSYFEMLRASRVESNYSEKLKTPSNKEIFNNDCSLSLEGLSWSYEVHKKENFKYNE
jgi:hypothetical protein